MSAFSTPAQPRVQSQPVPPPWMPSSPPRRVYHGGHYRLLMAFTISLYSSLLIRPLSSPRVASSSLG